MKKNVAGQHIGAEVINATTGAGVTASVTVTVSGNGGAYGASGGTLTHLANGWWDYAPTQAETNFDYIAFQFIATGAIPTVVSCYTMFPQSGDNFPAVNTNLDATVSSRLATSGYTAPLTAATTRSAVGLASANLDTQLSGIPGSTWDVTLSSHLTAGTTGNALNASGSAGDPWVTALPGAYGAGSAGNILGNNLNATVSSRLPTASITLTGGKVDVNDKTGFSLSAGGVQAVWDALTSALTTVGSIGKTLVTNVDATISSRLSTAGYTAPDNADILLIKAKTDNLPASPAAVGSAMTLTSGERTSVADSLLDRDMSVGVDSGSPSVRTVRQALRFLRNKFALSGTALTVYKEDDTTSSWTSVVGTDPTANPVISSDPA